MISSKTYRTGDMSILQEQRQRYIVAALESGKSASEAEAIAVELVPDHLFDEVKEFHKELNRLASRDVKVVLVIALVLVCAAIGYFSF